MKRLTEREREVANLVAEGFGNKEVAARLYISDHTVKAELEHIFEKLNMKNRVQLAVYTTKCKYGIPLN